GGDGEQRLAERDSVRPGRLREAADGKRLGLRVLEALWSDERVALGEHLERPRVDAEDGDLEDVVSRRIQPRRLEVDEGERLLRRRDVGARDIATDERGDLALREVERRQHQATSFAQKRGDTFLWACASSSALSSDTRGLSSCLLSDLSRTSSAFLSIATSFSSSSSRVRPETSDSSEMVGSSG